MTSPVHYLARAYGGSRSIGFIDLAPGRDPARKRQAVSASRGVVVPERGGAPFQQIFLSGNGAPANVVYHRRNADAAAFRQISSGRGPVYYDLTFRYT